MPKISAYPTKGTPLSNDLTLIADASDGNVTKKATLGTIVTASSLSEGTPSGSGDTGTKGSLQFDASYLYVCTATDTWTRIALAW